MEAIIGKRKAIDPSFHALWCNSLESFLDYGQRRRVYSCGLYIQERWDTLQTSKRQVSDQESTQVRNCAHSEMSAEDYYDKKQTFDGKPSKSQIVAGGLSVASQALTSWSNKTKPLYVCRSSSCKIRVVLTVYKRPVPPITVGSSARTWILRREWSLSLRRRQRVTTATHQQRRLGQEP